jgi:hypothetical protein
MRELEGATIALGELFSSPYFFRIPEYQRPFSWDAEHFDDLISDLTSANPNEQYFLGTLVLHKVDDQGNHDVIDGQQRLTSLLTLFSCVRDLIEDKDLKEEFGGYILQKAMKSKDIPGKERLEVKDHEIFAKLVVAESGTLSCPPQNGLPEPEWRYVEAVQIFREDLVGMSQDDLETFAKFLVQRCVVIFLSTTSFQDAFRLFTIVNDRGKQLRRIDILKAQNIDPSIIGSQTSRVALSHKWEEYENDLGSDTFESIFHLIRLMVLKEKPSGDLLSEFNDKIIEKGIIKRGNKFLMKYLKCQEYTEASLSIEMF